MKAAKSKSDMTKNADKLSVKRKVAANDGGRKTSKNEKSVKDSNKPKRPASAFFVFMEDFRTQFKENHPNNKSVSVVGKAGGDKWKSLSDAEKAPYVAKAEKMKFEYNKTIYAYNKKLAGGSNADEGEEEESDKSKSDVNDEDDEEEGSNEEEDDD